MIINENNFLNEVINSDKPVLLDFWASWCGPCRVLSPIIEEISIMYGEKLKVGKINVDEEENLANKFNINSIPSVFILKNGKVVNSFLGYRPLEDVKKFVEDNI